ncbi:MAG TPA: hypothetical protein VFI02_17585 [Armatimonadota bacterium]|nr:hypothetical protein [Armatimonadota bacterium]
MNPDNATESGWINLTRLLLAIPPAVSATYTMAASVRPAVGYAKVVLISVGFVPLVLAAVFLLLTGLEKPLSIVYPPRPKIGLVLFSVFLVALGWFAHRPPRPSVMITDPAGESVVGSDVIIKGTASDMDAEIWVIVHPMRTRGYWVQSKTAVSEDHTWAELACFGAPDDFQITAVADPVEVLEAGQEMDHWPEAKAKSPIVMVVREAD